MINEKIIYSKSLKGIEMLRSLAYFGSNTIGINIFTQSTLLERIAGLIGYFPNAKVLSKEEQQFQILKILENTKLIDVQTFDDVVHITITLNEIRNDIEDDSFKSFEELKKSKNNSLGSRKLFDIYFEYLNYLNDNGFLDDVSIVFDFIKHAKKCIHTITLLEEETYTPLDLKLVQAFADNVETISISDLFTKKAESKTSSFVNPAYGEYNEIREALSYVIENNIPFDKVNFVFAQDNKYLDELYNLVEEYKIPVNFVSGVKISESNPYKLFNFLFDLEKVYFNSVDGYSALFSLSSFDTRNFTSDEISALIDVMGHLKISFDKDYNDEVLDKFLSCNYRYKIFVKYFNKDQLATDTFIEKLGALVNDFSEGIIAVTQKHCFFREDDHTVLDQGSISIISETYKHSLLIKNELIRRNYLERLKNVVLISEVSKPGFLNVLKLTNAMSWYRPYTFIFGLSSAYFPGKNKENYLISNALLKDINKKAVISDEKITKKVSSLSSYINLLNELGSEVHLSYSFFSLNDVKEVNPCSIIYSLKSDDELKDIKKTKDVRNNKISGYRGIADIAIDPEKEKEIVPYNNVLKETSNPLEKVYSPSNIDDYFKCPKMFFLKKIYGLKEEDEYDPFETITALVYGNLIHKSMEYMKNHNKCTKEEFIENGLSNFNDYICYDVPTFDISGIKNDYTVCLGNAYDILKDNNLTIVECEKELTGKFKNLKLGGRFDALAKTTTGYVLLDYKTGKKIKHNEDDVETGRQMMIYFDLLKQNGTPVSQGYYIYPRVNSIVSMNLSNCDLDKFNSDMEAFENALVNNEFPGSKDEICRFCKYQSVCGKNVKIYER